MFDALVREAIALAGFDPTTVPLPCAAEAWAELDQVDKLVTGAKLRLAGRVAEGDEWRKAGHRSPEAHLAAMAGSTVGAARDIIAASKKLRELPEVDTAVREGRLSGLQAVAVADAAAAAPDQQTRLLSAASKESLGGLREACARTKAAALPDDAARHQAVHQARCARKRSCADGAAEILYRSTPTDVAEIWAVIEAYADRQFKAARADSRHEPYDAYLADALLAMARAANDGGGARAVTKKVIVRVDWTALLRGYVIQGETCEIPGLGPIPVTALRDILATEDPFLAAVVTRGHDVATVAHLGRTPNAWQQSALEWLDPVCCEDGCNNRAHLERDHHQPYSLVKLTQLENLRWRCKHHHRQKTRDDLSKIRDARDHTPDHLADTG